MKLFLVRHGQSEGDLKNIIEGNADFDLTEYGYQQAREIAGGLNQYGPFDIIYSSPLQRAKNTAGVIAEHFELEIITDSRIAERNVGIMAGMDREEAMKKFPLKPGGLKPHFKMGGGTGENLLYMQYRISEFFSEITDKHFNQKVIVVSHGGAINCTLHYLLKMSDNNIFATSDSGIHYLEIRNERTIIHFLNRIIPFQPE